MYEINLVPTVKAKMLKMIKLRNLILFICILVGAGCAGIIAILGGITGVQSITIADQDSRILAMSNKINGYEGISEYVMIKDQLNGLTEISDKKRVLSRVFNMMDVFLPKNGDSITISAMNIDLDNATISLEAQANAGIKPDIDYRVLESFKKGATMVKYDYGRYVDENNNEIPTRCIEETDPESGVSYSENGIAYVIWHRSERGCNPSVKEESNESDAEDKKDEKQGEEEQKAEDAAKESDTADKKIYRTPRFSEWVKDGKMTLEGSISGIPHFESQCIQYTGEDQGEGKNPKWTSENNCQVLSTDVLITDSSNGRDDEDQLVLRFEATLTLNPEVFSFKNKHFMAMGPNKQNVTDSFLQIDAMFGERASDCEAGDSACSAANETLNDNGEGE